MDKEKHRIAAVEATQAQQPQASYVAEGYGHSLLDGLLTGNRKRRPARKSSEMRASAEEDAPSAPEGAAQHGSPENFEKETTGRTGKAASAEDPAFSRERVPDAVREYYQALLNAPVPDAILNLVKKLGEKEKTQGRETDPEGNKKR